MKWAIVCLSGVCLPLWAAELSGVHTVYMLSMSNGMDQYLANRLTSEHVIQVVTDPQRADAIFTDRLGESFEDKLDDLYPPPEPEEGAKSGEKAAPKAPAKDASKNDAPKNDASKNQGADKGQDAGNATALPGVEPMNKLPRLVSSFGRAKGTIFLVDVKSRQVLWSTYERPKDTSSHQLDRTARRIVERLKLDLAGKSEQP